MNFLSFLSSFFSSLSCSSSAHIDFCQRFSDALTRLDVTHLEYNTLLYMCAGYLLTSTASSAIKTFLPPSLSTGAHSQPSPHLRIKPLAVFSIVAPLNLILRSAYHKEYAEIAGFNIIPVLAVELARDSTHIIRRLPETISLFHRIRAGSAPTRVTEVQRHHHRCTMIGLGFIASALVTHGFAASFNTPAWKAYVFFTTTKLVVDNVLKVQATRAFRPDRYSHLLTRP